MERNEDEKRHGKDFRKMIETLKPYEQQIVELASALMIEKAVRGEPPISFNDHVEFAKEILTVVRRQLRD